MKEYTEIHNFLNVLEVRLGNTGYKHHKEPFNNLFNRLEIRLFNNVETLIWMKSSK